MGVSLRTGGVLDSRVAQSGSDSTDGSVSGMLIEPNERCDSDRRRFPH
jgi:hypothetical protein